MKKWLSIMVITSLAITILSACSKEDKESARSGTPVSVKSTEAPVEAVKIQGKVTLATNRTDLIETNLKEYAEQFHAKYPDATVEFQAIKDYDQTIKIRMASNELPDIILIPGTVKNSDLPTFFAPLDDLGLNDRIYFKDNRSLDGKLYGISSGSSAMGITYNKKAFQLAGITEVPKTLDEFLAACEKLKAKGIIPLATNFKDKWPLYGWDQEAYVVTGDAGLHNSMAKQEAPFAVDGPHWKAFSILKTLVDKGYTEKDLMSTNWEASKKDVASGKMAMYLLGNWVVPQVIDNGSTTEDVGFFPLPLDNTGNAKAIIASDYFYGVNKKSANLPAAKALLKWIVEESGYSDFAGFIPVLKDKKPVLKQLADFMAMNPTMIEMQADNDEYLAISNKMQFDTSAFAQDAIMGDDMKKVFAEYDKKWQDAKKSLEKK
ncbi:extracellular solute-binding protein [Paenibacillus psychroresistens]|uniref:Extracellular solute-binding protein n=1 Tax=Paenibacillus psychroresistens TaxID=1778678 RepID=A0A6B8RQT3_9BACL|nr:extracellular solute-binding protein [Paenibacillus psychroresistens]QGQ98359.1 extracellular solute-binding protein [Paenibacillus psychroresistens]